LKIFHYLLALLLKISYIANLFLEGSRGSLFWGKVMSECNNALMKKGSRCNEAETPLK